MKKYITTSAIFLIGTFLFFNFIGFLYWLMDHGYNVALAAIVAVIALFGIHALFEIERSIKK